MSDKSITVAFLKSIFVPRSSFVDKNIGSIESLIELLIQIHCHCREGTIEIILRFEGWVVEGIEMVDKINTCIREKISRLSGRMHLDVSFAIYRDNLGKKHILKNVYDTFLQQLDCGLIVYADHDIIFTDSSTDYILHVIQLQLQLQQQHRHKDPLEYWLDQRPVKMISFNQSVDVRHHPLLYQTSITINGVTYCVPTSNLHVALGCFIGNKSLYSDLFKGITASGIVYGDEDIQIGTLLDEIGGLNLVTLDHVVIHPFETDKEYVNWKMNCVFDVVKRTITAKN